MNFFLRNGQTSSVVPVLCNYFSHSVMALKSGTGLKITVMHYACGIQDTTTNLSCSAFYST